MGIQNFYDMYERITTKYYIVLEGDDFGVMTKNCRNRLSLSKNIRNI